MPSPSPAQTGTVEATIARIAIFNPMRFMTSSFRASCTHRRHVQWTPSLQITDIGRDGFDLGPGQIVRRRRHDGGGVNRSTLTALLPPTRQLAHGVRVELTRQSRNLILTLALGAVAGGAGRDGAFGKFLLEDLLCGN